METAVRMIGIAKSFGAVDALTGVTLELKKGEVLALLGDNGAGKSTLIKILSGFHRPDLGEMEIGGRRIDWSRYDVRRAREIGVETVYQERSLGERQPLWRNVFVGRHLVNAFGMIDVKREKVETMKLLTEIVGLRGVGIHADASVATLSGGERQGLAIARAMYFDASIIILDEPTAGLDPLASEILKKKIIKEKNKGKLIIITSHLLSELDDIVSEIIFMNEGKILVHQSVEDLLHQTNSEKISESIVTILKEMKK